MACQGGDTLEIVPSWHLPISRIRVFPPPLQCDRFILRRSCLENFGPKINVQYSSRLRMISGRNRSAAACNCATSSTARKALSFL